MRVEGTARVAFLEHLVPVGEAHVYCCGARDADAAPFSAHWPHVAFFCPKCGDLWGRAVWEYEFDYRPRVVASWRVEARLCVACGDGQFLAGWPLDGASEDLLTREFHALLEGVTHEYHSNT